MRVLPLLLSLLVCVPPAAAQADRDFGLMTERESILLETARAHLLSFRLPAADRAFQALADLPGGAPAAYHHLALSAFLRAMVSDSDAHYERFFAFTDTLETALGAMPEGPWRAYLVAENDLRRAVAYGKQGRYVRAAFAARSAHGGFRSLVDAHPTFYEPYKGLGLVTASIGALPSGYRTFLDILGYTGSVEQGLAYLRRAEAHSRYVREESATLLAVADVMFRRPEAALERLEALNAAYPESPFFGHLYGFALLENRKAAAARRVLEAAARYGHDGRHFPVVYVDFYLARAALYAGDYAAAAERYQQYLARQESDALRALAYVEMGWALELMGNRTAAEAAYRAVRVAREFDSDAAARREAERRLAGPMSAVRRELLLGALAYDAGRHEEVERRLGPIRASSAVPADARAEVAYRLGRSRQARGEEASAADAYREAVRIAGAPDRRWAPWSLYHLGELHAEAGRTREAREAFQAALAFPTPFDYHQALEQSARVALERLDG